MAPPPGTGLPGPVYHPGGLGTWVAAYSRPALPMSAMQSSPIPSGPSWFSRPDPFSSGDSIGTTGGVAVLVIAGQFVPGMLMGGASDIAVEDLAVQNSLRAGGFTGDGNAGWAAEEESVTLYRGVTADHPGFADATEGTVYPRGGDGSVFDHALGDTRTEYTSWSSDPATASAFATRGGGPGIVLETQVSPSSIYLSPDEFGESEFLLKGPVLNATPTSVTPY